MQDRIDNGIQWCEPCKVFGHNRFCGDCGRRFNGDGLEWRECPKCAATVATDWCPLCGACVADEFLRAMERGEIDMEAESKKAAEIMKLFYALDPEFSPAAYNNGGKPTLGDAVLRAFNDG